MNITAITRFSDYSERSAAASFRCAVCGGVAGVVRVAHAGTPVDMGPPLGTKTPARDGLVLEKFIGTAWFAQPGQILDAVQALIGLGSVDPLAIREIDWTLWELTPFYCPDCALNYCRRCWSTRVVFDEEFYDCTEGTCPGGHRHTLDDRPGARHGRQPLPVPHRERGALPGIREGVRCRQRRRLPVP